MYQNHPTVPGIDTLPTMYDLPSESAEEMETFFAYLSGSHQDYFGFCVGWGINRSPLQHFGLGFFDFGESIDNLEHNYPLQERH
jgi:hypothetical protein